MMKKIYKAYKFFDLGFNATQEELEHAVVIKTQRLQKRYAKNTTKMNVKIGLIKEYQEIILSIMKNGEFKPKERKYNEDSSSIFSLIAVLIFSVIFCMISFYLIS